jgi:hypothetical protein
VTRHGADARILEEIAAELSHCANGLAFISETDAPFEPFVLPDATPASLVGAVGSEGVELMSLEDALRGQLDVHPADVEALERVPRFVALIELFQQRLVAPVAVRVPDGPARYRILLIGSVREGIAGLETRAVES